MLRSCSRCEGFLPTATTNDRVETCPHCGLRLPTRTPRRAAVGVAAFTAVSLMACYGMAYPPPNVDTRAAGIDNDGDGYSQPNGATAPGVFDCDDTRRDIHPGAEDVPGDQIDQDCDGVDGTAPSAQPGAVQPAPTASIAVDPPR